MSMGVTTVEKVGRGHKRRGCLLELRLPLSIPPKELGSLDYILSPRHLRCPRTCMHSSPDRAAPQGPRTKGDGLVPPGVVPSDRGVVAEGVGAAAAPDVGVEELRLAPPSGDGRGGGGGSRLWCGGRMIRGGRNPSVAVGGFRGWKGRGPSAVDSTPPGAAPKYPDPGQQGDDLSESQGDRIWSGAGFFPRGFPNPPTTCLNCSLWRDLSVWRIWGGYFSCWRSGWGGVY